MSDANCFACAFPALFATRKTSLGKHCSLCKASHDFCAIKELMSDANVMATPERHTFGMCRAVGIVDANKSSKLGTSTGQGVSRGVHGIPRGGMWFGTAALLLCATMPSSNSNRGPLHWQQLPSRNNVRQDMHT
jgi:hypothetical protein